MSDMAEIEVSEASYMPVAVGKQAGSTLLVRESRYTQGSTLNLGFLQMDLLMTCLKYCLSCLFLHNPNPLDIECASLSAAAPALSS